MKRFRALVPLAGLVALALPGVSPGASPPSVVPIRDRAPAWFTPDLARRAVEAGARGVPLPRDATIRTSSLGFVGIRPGQQIVIADTTDLVRADELTLCSANFVFTNGTTTTGAGAKKAGARKPASGGSTYYIGTAGHCGTVGQKVFMIFAPLGVAHIGDIVKSTFSENRLAPDFALVAIKRQLDQYVSPSMAHVGGPTGAYTGRAIEPVLHSGHGLVVGTGGTPRAGVAFRWGDEWRFEGAIAPGDSGSGAIVVGGLAAGNITHIAVNAREGVPVWMGGTSITKILSLVGGLQLATCSLPVPWPAPGCPPV